MEKKNFRDASGLRKVVYSSDYLGEKRVRKTRTKAPMATEVNERRTASWRSTVPTEETLSQQRLPSRKPALIRH